MLTISDLTFSYSPKSANVLSGLNLSLNESCVYGLLGRNGSGKTTLLHLMAGLLFPVHGKVVYNNVETRQRKPEVLADMFMLPDEFDLPAMTMSQYVEYYAPFYTTFSNEVLAACMEDFGIACDVRLDTLSLGDRKKAYISFAIATRVGLLLMDEPTNGLDIPSKSTFRKVMARHLTDRQTVVISTHQVHDVSTLFDELLVLQADGSILHQSLEDMAATTENIEERFVKLTNEGKESE